jgi:hypothetical protein
MSIKYSTGLVIETLSVLVMFSSFVVFFINSGRYVPLMDVGFGKKFYYFCQFDLWDMIDCCCKLEFTMIYRFYAGFVLNNLEAIL